MDDSVVGTEVEGYRIQEVLGRGGMGVVYKAKDIALSREVALKRIDPSLANDETFLRRFRSEARALARIDSPYIVGVHALRQTEIGLLLVMEYVEGGTLKDLMMEGPMDWEEALPIIKQMLKALAHAHSAEVIHRDIKPRNIMLSTDGTVKVTDFGLAKVYRPDADKTVTQGVHGTLNYMSPEQVQGSADLDHRSDLYSLGMTIYEMLAGELPFEADSSEFTKMRTIVEEPLPRPDQLHPQVPDGLSALVMKALEKNPSDRFQSAEVMHDAFEAFGEKHGGAAPTPPAEGAVRASSTGSSSRRWGGLVGVAALALLVAAGGYWLLSGGSGAPPPRTQLSVETEPPGASVFVEGTRIGATPLTDSLEVQTARLQVQRAGYVPLDTSIQLTDGRPVDLNVRLAVEPTPLTVETSPAEADVYLGDELIGRTPLDYTIEDSTARLRVQRQGYVTIDTLVHTVHTDQVRLALQLQRDADPSDPNGGGNTTGSGTLALSALPAGTVYVDGEVRTAGQSLQLPAGRHRIRFEHSQYGTKDTTLTVEAGETETLTCYFEHEVVVRSKPWANVHLDGANTGESTPHRTELGTGIEYRVGARIQSRPYTVTGGTYLRRGAESGVILGPQEFTGNTKIITLQPSFEHETHIIDFHTSGSES